LPTISKIHAREIVDSRGEPTVEVEVEVDGGGFGLAQVESGASIGSYEMHELRDGDMGRLQGRGVTRVVENVNQYLAPQIIGVEFASQRILDQYLTGLDGTPSLERYGANGILGVSRAFAGAWADQDHKPLFRHFAESPERQEINNSQTLSLPKPMFTLFNGGKLASFSTDVQEFNIVMKPDMPFKEALRMGAEIYHAVGDILLERGYDKKLGDEGGYAVPDATTDQGMTLMMEGTERAGYAKETIGIVLDEAANNLFTDARLYHLAHHDGDVPAKYLIDKFEKLLERFPLMGVEDGLADQDWDGWIELSKRLGQRMMIIGDDIFSTNAVRLRKGQGDKIANALTIKPTQIGTLTGAIDAVNEATKLGYTSILSHRSGDTEAAYMAHFAVGYGFPYVKFGAPARGERVAKYNELLRIEEQLEENNQAPSTNNQTNSNVQMT